MSVYIFKLEEDYIITNIGLQVNAKKELISNGFKCATINRNGSMIIHKGYAWDGCTPKFKICNRIIGTPDGKINKETGKPKTYYASLVHDVLYQFLKRNDGVYTRKQADDIFYMLMKASRFPFSWLYYGAVRLLGGIVNAL